jgi:uncharacterized protein YqcC (DUF446 family)
MSRSFGPIDTRADFFDALSRSIAFAESDAFWDAALRPTVRTQLRAITAWTDRDRSPRLAERAAITLSWSIARARESYPSLEPAAWIEPIELVSHVGWYFTCWPENDEDGRTQIYSGAARNTRAPSLEEIRAAAAEIYRALHEAGRIDDQRPDEAFQSKEPLLRDRMSTTSWIQWVLLPRLESVVRGETPAPPKSQLCALCMHLADDRATWPLLQALGALDDLFVRPLPNHRAPRPGEL